MTTPAKMRSAQEWGIDIHRLVTWRMQSKYEGLAHLASVIQQDAIAFTEARVRAQVVEECAEAIDQYTGYEPDGADLSAYELAFAHGLIAAINVVRALAAKPVEKQE